MSEPAREMSPELKELRRQCVLAERSGDEDALTEALEKYQAAARKELAEKRNGGAA